MNRDFKGIWIPKELWIRDDMSFSEKILLMEIDSLDSGDGCWAGNSHFATLLNLSPMTIKNMITSMSDRGLISQSPGEKRILRSLVPRHEKMPVGHEKMPEAARKNADYKESNTNSNNTTTLGPSAPINKDCEWDGEKVDLRRFVMYFLKKEAPAIFEAGNSKQIGGFFSQYGKMFKKLLATAGNVERACFALDLCASYYKNLGYSWGLTALNKNWSSFVAEAMAKGR